MQRVRTTSLFYSAIWRSNSSAQSLERDSLRFYKLHILVKVYTHYALYHINYKRPLQHMIMRCNLLTVHRYGLKPPGYLLYEG